MSPFKESEKEFQAERPNVVSPIIFTKEFWDRHRDFERELKKNGFKDEECVRLFVLKDLRQAVTDLGMSEIEKKVGDKNVTVRYEKEGDKKSAIILDIDTFDCGTFEIRLILGKNNKKEPDIVIRPTSNYKAKVIEQIFSLLAERGIFISPIFLMKQEEKYPFPPDSPLGLPPSATKIKEEQLESLIKGVPPRGYAPEAFFDWPRIGTKGLRTEYGIINGSLVYCDEVIAIFMTPQGLMKISFGDLLDPFGIPYKEKLRKKRKKENGGEEKGDLKYWY